MKIMLKLQVILGSTRPGRAGEEVAKWFVDIAKQRPELEVELVDVADYNLPLLDEPKSALTGEYVHQHTKDWSAKVSQADAYVFVTPEYNHGVPAALKNAVDFLYHEWTDKVFGFVSYGAAEGGSRSVEHWRQIVSQLGGATVHNQLSLQHIYMGFKPEDEANIKGANGVLDDVIRWGNAFATIKK